MVVRKENESIDSLLKRFKKEVQNAGIITDYMKTTEYIGPAEKRRRKSEAARKRIVRMQKKYNRD